MVTYMVKKQEVTCVRTPNIHISIGVLDCEWGRGARPSRLIASGGLSDQHAQNAHVAEAVASRSEDLATGGQSGSDPLGLFRGSVLKDWASSARCVLGLGWPAFVQAGRLRAEVF